MYDAAAVKDTQLSCSRLPRVRHPVFLLCWVISSLSAAVIYAMMQHSFCSTIAFAVNFTYTWASLCFAVSTLVLFGLWICFHSHCGSACGNLQGSCTYKHQNPLQLFLCFYKPELSVQHPASGQVCICVCRSKLPTLDLCASAHTFLSSAS